MDQPLFYGADGAPPRSVLVIDAPEALPLIEALDPPPRVLAIRFRQLGVGLLALAQPDCVALPLLRPGFDALEVIEKLQALGYTGHICAFAPPLPDPDLVAAELQQAAAGLPLRLIIVGA